MALYTIAGGTETSGEITVSGSKNAALPLLAATLFYDHAILHNVPDISDVHLLIEIFRSLGSVVSYDGSTCTIDHSHISLARIEVGLFKKARATYYLIPPLLSRFGSISVKYPGGCTIGKRPIDGILQGLATLGFESHDSESDGLDFQGAMRQEDAVVNAYFSVGSTIVLLLAAIKGSHTTTIQMAAYEPHVMNLIDVLRSSGADIALRYDHTIIVSPHALASHLEGSAISDYLVSGTLAVIGALTAHDFLDIHQARIADLTAFLYVIGQMGVRYEDLGGDTLRIFRSVSLTPTTLQTNIFPGFPTDIQSPTSILMTQAEGVSRLHEVMFEGRLNWLVELEKMRGHIAILNPHEALVFGKTPLRGTRVSSWDLRSGAAMLIAGLIAEGTTMLDNVSYIERGYAHFVDDLRSVGAHITIHDE